MACSRYISELMGENNMYLEVMVLAQDDDFKGDIFLEGHSSRPFLWLPGSMLEGVSYDTVLIESYVEMECSIWLWVKVGPMHQIHGKPINMIT